MIKLRKLFKDLEAQRLLPIGRENGFAPLSQSCFDARQGTSSGVERMALAALPKPLDAIPAERLTSGARAEVERIRKEYEGKPPAFLFSKGVLRKSAFEVEMNKMDWAFFMASATTRFLTCDDPARLNGAGLGNKDALIMFPLSKNLLLQCKWHSGWRNDFHQLSDEQVDYFNLWTVKGAREKVYASERSEDIRLLVESEIATMDSWI